MGKLIMKSAPLSGDPEVKVPSFNFCRYEAGQEYHNDENRIDFVTDGKSLYVCLVSHTATEANVANEQGFLKLVSEGPQGIQGVKGDDGADAVTPVMSAEFIGDQLKLIINNKIAALSPSLTGPSWKPVLEDNAITWELTNDRYAPESIDLETLRPIQKSPLLLRTNSDNTKRSDETSGPANFIQWKYEGDEYWTNLISISELMNLALAGVSVWKNEDDQKWHLGHREVIKATYDSDKNGRKIISNVILGDILFDAGELPFAESAGGNDYGADIDLIWQKLAELELSMVKTVNHEGPDPDGNVNVETGSGASLDGYATETWVTSHYQPKGNYVTSISVNGGSPITPTNGNINLTITSGDTVLFDVRFDNSSHKLQKTTDGQNWTDLVDLDDYTGGEGCEHCWTEEEILALISNSLSNYYTKAQVYTKGEVDAMLGGYTNSYRTFMIFKRSASATTETLPNTTITWNVSTGELDIPNGSNGWQEHPANATSQTPYLWMASASFQSIDGTRVGNWDGPFCLTGENGQDGADGTDIEFAYILCTKAEYNTLKNTTPVATHGDGRADDLPSGTTASGNAWTDHPSGISEEYPIEAVTIRKKNNGVWSAYCKPTIWSMWGEDGVDGDGVEYIFCITAQPSIGAFAAEIPLTQQAVNELGASYQVDDWLPLNGNGNWTDNPLSVDEQQPYEWVAIRKYHAESGWGPFSEPKVWGLWGQKTITTTVVEDGTTYYKPYTCYAFTRTNTDLTGYSVDYTFNDYSQLTPEQKSAFYDNPLDFVKTLDTNNNLVNNITWYDTVPNTSGQLWLITNHIGDEGDPNETAWNGPIKWGDNAGFQIEYAASDSNTDAVYAGTKTLPSLNPYKDNSIETINESAWRTAAAAANCGTWSDNIVEPVYMATAYKKGDGNWSTWTIAKVKGENGRNGIDGTNGSDGKSIEFVYYRTAGVTPGIELDANEAELGTYDVEDAVTRTKVVKDPLLDDFFPSVDIATKTDGNYWHDHPSGVTEQLPYEWVATRTSALQNGVRYWSSNFSVALWSKFGADGRDGDGVEYVFWGLSEQDVQQLNSTWPTQQASNAQNNGTNVDPTRKDTLNRSITNNEYLPAILINNVKIQAVDDNPGIENYKYVFASMRRYNGQSKEWGEFSQIKLWNEQPASARENVVLDIKNDAHPIYVDENGRISDRRMSYSYSTDNMYLYKDLVLLSNGDVYITNSSNVDVKIAELLSNSVQTNCYNNISSNEGISVSSNGLTAKVYPTWAWKYEDSNSSIVNLKVVFDKVNNQNPVLNNSFDIIIKVKSADEQFIGSDILRLTPVYTDKEIELLSVPRTQRTSVEGGTTYSDSMFTFYGFYGDTYKTIDLVAETEFYFKYDSQVNWTKFRIPVNNTTLANLKSNVDGQSQGSAYFYFDRTGSILPDNTGAFYRLWLYNSDYDDNTHGIWTNWMIQASVIVSAFTDTNDYPTKELYFGIGFDNDVIDEANVHIIYPGAPGPQGPKGNDGLQGPKGDDGKTVISYQYLEGKVVRISDWTDEQLAFYDGDDLVDGVYYVDVVKYTSGNNTTYYKCKDSITYTANNKPASPATDTTHWEVYTPQADSFFDSLLANSAYIENLTSKQVVITDTVNNQTKIVAGMTSDSVAGTELDGTTTGDVRIWAGEMSTAGNLTTAPFTVTSDGTLNATKANISNSATETISNVNYDEHVEISPNKIEITHENTSNNASAGVRMRPNSQNLGDRTAATLEVWQETTGPALGVSGILKQRSGLFVGSITNINANSQTFDIDSNLAIVTHNSGSTGSGLYSTAVVPFSANDSTSTTNGAHITFLRIDKGVCRIQPISGTIELVTGTNSTSVPYVEFTSSDTRVDVVRLENTIYAWKS